MIPRDPKHSAFSRDVRQILRASEIGLRWADNIGPIVEFDYVSTDAPIKVQAPVPEEPLSVIVLRVSENGSATRESGTVVVWSWDAGSLSIELEGLPSATTKYRVTVGLLMG